MAWSAVLVRVSLDRPAGAAERAPEQFQIRDRQLARPCAGMVMPVDGTCIRAITAHRELAAKRRLCCARRIGPGAIAAEAAHRRPVRHCRWRSTFIVSGKITGGVDNLATNDSEIGSRVGDLALRAGEIVTVGDDHVRELAYLDASLPTLLIGEPGHVFRPHAQRSLAIKAVALWIDSQSGDCFPGDKPSER